MLDNEQQIVEESKKDFSAFGVVFDEYYDAILGYTLRRTADVHVARDLVSEVFYKALRGINSFQWCGISVLHWLYRIANNEIASFFKNPDRRFVSLDKLKSLGLEFSSNADLENEIVEAEETVRRHREFLRAREQISQLPVCYQEVICLRFFEAKKICEIADILGRKESTTKALLYRGLDKLREMV